jgi:hypothetical protein
MATNCQHTRTFMIDLSKEQPFSLAAATAFVPPARNGKRTHLSTLLRWILTGCKAPSGEVVRLEAVRLGGRWMTSREAIQRFAEKLTPRMGDAHAPAPRTSKQRQRDSERAAVVLEKLGI